MPEPTPEPAPRPTPQPASADASDAPRALDLVRARFPRTSDQDAPGLVAHAEHLAALRRQVDVAALRGRESALTFDPRSGAS